MLLVRTRLAPIHREPSLDLLDFIMLHFMVQISRVEQFVFNSAWFYKTDPLQHQFHHHRRPAIQQLA